MAHTRRAQILMEPEEYEQLVRIAQLRMVSVAELVRTAVRVLYFCSPDDRKATVARIAAMELPVGRWEEMKQEIEGAYDAGLS